MKAGTTITTRIRLRRATGWRGTSSTRLLIKVLKVLGVAKAIKVASVNSLLQSEREAA